MLNCKVKCIKAGTNSFTKNKIYQVINGTLIDNNSMPYEETTDLNELNIKLKSKFELYEEPQSSPIKDSGNRREFGTGAVRDMQEGKGRCDLLPAVAILRLARHFENGCKKYGDRNWEKGIPIHSFIDSAIRHLMKYLDGQTDEDHLCAAAWNCICAMWTEEKHPELQDIPSRVATDNNVVTKTPDVPDKNVGEIKKACINCKFLFLDEADYPCSNRKGHDLWERENNE